MTLQNVVDYLKTADLDMFEGCTTPEPIDIELVKSYIMLRCGLLTPVYYEPTLMKMQTKMWFDKMQWEFDKLVQILLAEYDPIDNVTEDIATTEMHSGTDKRKLGGNDRFSHGETHTLSGTDTLTHGEKHTLSGTDTNNDTTTTEHQVSAYNTAAYQSDSKDINGGYTNTQYGKVDTASGDDKTQYGKKDTATGDDKTQYGRTDTASGTDQTLYGKTDDLTHGERIETRVHRHGNIGVVSPGEMINEQLDLLERFNVYDWIARKFERDNMIQVY